MSFVVAEWENKLTRRYFRSFASEDLEVASFEGLLETFQRCDQELLSPTESRLNVVPKKDSVHSRS